MTTRGRFAAAGLLAAGLVIPLLLTAQGATRGPLEVVPQVQIWPVTIRNECPGTVWLFYGRHPPLHPRNMVTLGPKMQSSEPLMPGDIVWLLNPAAEELDRAHFHPSIVAIRIRSSCVRLEPVHAER